VPDAHRVSVRVDGSGVMGAVPMQITERYWQADNE
jgi:hypothetical protein